MPEYLGDALFELRANVAPLRRSMAEAESITMNSVRRMETGLSGGLGRVSSRMATIGHSMTRGLTIPIIGIGAASAKMAINFQAAMENIHTQAGASQREVDKLSSKVLALAKTVPFGPVPLADALYHLESIGLRLNKAMEQVGLQARKQIPLMQVLKVAAEGAAVGHANLEQTTTALGSAWLSGIQGAQNLGKTMGTLNAIVGTGNMRMQDLVTALGTGVLPMAKLAGLSLKDVGAALAIFSDEGYPAYSAATQMATALHYLYDPTVKASKALDGIGLKTGQLAGDMHKPNGLLVALTDLKSHLDASFPPNGQHAMSAEQMAHAVDTFTTSLQKSGVSGKKLTDDVDKYKAKLKELGTAAVAQEAVIGDIFPAGRGRVLSVLMNQLTNYQAKLGQVGKGQKQFTEDVRATQETAAYKIHQAWATIQSDLTQIGEKVLPIAAKGASLVANEVNKVVNSFERLSPSTQKAIVTGGLIVAAVGPAMRVASFFLGGVKLWVNGIEKAWGLVKGMSALAAGRGIGGGGGGGMVAQMRVAEMVVGNMTTPGAPMRGGAPTIAERGTTGTFSAPLGGGGEPRVPAGKPHFRPTAAQFYPEPVYVREPPPRMYPTAAARSPMMAEASLAPLAVGGAGARVASGFARAGGMALQAAGVAALVAMFAPAGAVLGKALFRWLNGPEPKSFGEKFAEDFTAPLGKHVGEKFNKRISEARDNLTGAVAYTDQLAAARRAFGAANVRGARGQTFGAGSLVPSAADERKIEKAGFNLGWLTGKATVAGLKSVRDPNANILLRDFTTQLRRLPAQARPEAAKVMLNFAESLHRNGKLPSRELNFVIKGLQAQFPGLTNFMTRQGLSSDKALAATFRLGQSQNSLKRSLGTIRSRFGDLAIDPNVTGKNLNKNVNQAMQDLQLIVNTSTGKTKRDALAQMKALRDGVTNYFKNMAHQVGVSTGSMKDLVAAGSFQAYKIGAKNWQAFTDQVNKAMASGTLSVSKGSEIIAKGLNDTLKAFGEAPLGIATIKGMTPAQLAAVASGQVSSGAAASPHARGGLVTIGHEGERGGDNVPLQILAGRGEKVAVFNAQQQAVMDHHLSPYGGLEGMFANFNQPHYAFSGGGFVPRWNTQRFAKGGLAKMIATANAIDAKHYSYLMGGGHNASFSGPYDCSGAVSAVLHSAGLLNTPLASQELSTAFLPGPGIVTVYAHGPDGPNGHAIMSLGGRFFGTSGSNPGGGAGWFPTPSASYLSAFARRHVLADAATVKAPKVLGKGTIPNIVRGALNMEAKGANKYVQAHMPTGPLVGDGGGNFTGGGVSAKNWLVKVSQEGAASGSGWTELSTNGNAAAATGNPHTASHTGGWDFATLGREYPHGTMLNIKSTSTGRSGTFPLTDVGDGSSFGPAIGLTPAAYGALGGMPSTVEISMADGSLIEMAKGFGRVIGSGASGGPKSARQLGLHSRGGFVPMARGGFVRPIGKRPPMTAASAALGNPSPPSRGQIGAFYKIAHALWARLSKMGALPAWARREPRFHVQSGGAGGDRSWNAVPYTTPARQIYFPWSAVWAAEHPENAYYDWAQEAIVHEIAHTNQNARTFDNRTLAEGGAQAWADQWTPHVASRWHSVGDSNYAGYVNWVKRHMGWNWIDHGQFSRYAKGGFGMRAAPKTTPRQRGTSPGTGRPGHRRHSVVSPLTGRQLGVLSKAGEKVNTIEQDIATWTARFNSMSSRFSTDEGQLQYLAEDGSLNAKGISKKLQDDQTLYLIAYRLWKDYQHELGPVQKELRHWLGVRSHTQGEIDTLNKNLGKNRIKEVNLERAREALSKPTRDVVGALRDAIKKIKHYWDPRILADEGKLKHFHPRTVPPLYRGRNKTKREQNRKARAAAIQWNTSHRQALQGAVNEDHLRERGSLLPLTQSLDIANTKNRKRKDQIAKQRYKYTRELSALRSHDVKMRARVKTLKGILSGEPGATGDVEVDKSISLLEGVADKLGTVMWDKTGKFLGINTQQQGAAYDQKTEVDSLAIAIGQDKLLKPASVTADQLDTSVLAGYYQDIANQNALKFAISQAQYSALQGMPAFPGMGGRPAGPFGAVQLPPYAGSFATGGVVPGPLGAPRTAIVHGGEIIKNPEISNNVKVSLEDTRTRVVVDDVEHVMDMVNRRMTRSVSRRLPGNGGGIRR